MTLWVFVITMFLESFGGEITITVKTKDEESCWKVRSALTRAMTEMKKVVSDCVEAR